MIANTSLYNNTPGGTATNSQLLTGESGNIFGISKFLPIQAGDKVSMEVYGKYSTTTTANPYDFAANLVGNLLNQLPLTPAELQAAGLQSSISNDFATMGRSGLSNADGVSAYLNYILLDEAFTFVSAGYQMLPDNADVSHQQLAMELIPEQDGYVYIYLTNESQQLTDVYFDDFKITHEVLIKELQLEAYRYGFNGKEKDSKGEFGLNHYDYGFRIYNPAIAKFLSVDPLTNSYPWYTPYQFAGNKPINSIDFDGLEPRDINGNVIDMLEKSNLNFVSDFPVTFRSLWDDLYEHSNQQAKEKNGGRFKSASGKRVDIQGIDQSIGVRRNVDYYSLDIHSLPEDASMEVFFNQVRLSLDEFLPSGTLFHEFSPEDKAKWISDDPEEAVMQFDASPFRTNIDWVSDWVGDDLTVVATHYNADKTHIQWVFSTATTFSNGGHAVSGSRQFGISQNENGGFTFWTRGTDRANNAFDFLMSPVLFDGGDRLWTRFFENLNSYINKNGGESTFIEPVSERIYNGKEEPGGK